MIIFELERGIGRIIKESQIEFENNPIFNEISLRSGCSKNNIESIISSSYFGEVLSILTIITKFKPEIIWAEHLIKICDALQIQEIRNAVSHPNRPFPEYFWYRCAALASDPAIEALGLIEVIRAFENALQGTLEEIPDDWINKSRWSIPAIIPNNFEHSITGLLGRSKDISKLEKEIENQRYPLIAIVARGGVGKTSLALQVIYDFCLSPKATSLYDAAIWVTLKQEQLTTHGVEFLTAPKSIEELENEIKNKLSILFSSSIESNEDILDACKEKRILLCIDNLETVLRDYYKDFIDFYESLPAKWRIIVTSRIPLDAAKTIAIDVLDSNGAIAMARNYLASKGSDKSKNQEFIEKIAVGAKKNPLAIRLTIDLYLSGKDISDALAKGDQDVLTFSFTSLIETLSDNEVKILESLFVLEDPTKSDLCSILKLSHDEVSFSISRLSSMSLISREDDDNYETYSLASSIRDLLRVNPKKPEIRQQVVSQISKEKSTALSLRKQLSDRNVKPISLEFAPEHAERKYLPLLQQVSSAVKNNYRPVLQQLIEACKRKIDSDKNSAILYRIYAHALIGLEDYIEAINFFNKAYSIEPNDHATKYGLQIAYTSLRDHDNAFNTGVFLIENGWGEPEASGNFIANRIWNWTLRSSNFKDDLSFTFEKTSNWEERSHELPALGLSRCSAFRRLLDIEKKNGNLSFQREIDIYAKAANIMTIVPVQNDYPKWMTAEIGRLANDIKSFLIENEHIIIDYEKKDEINKLLSFYKSILLNSSKLQINGFSNEIINFCKEVVGEEINEESTTNRINQYKSNGFTIARIKTREINIGKPIFAKDEINSEYYISKELIPKKLYKDKKRLYGNIVAIKHRPNINKNKASTVIEIYFL